MELSINVTLFVTQPLQNVDITTILRSYESKKFRQELQSSYKLQNAPCKPLFSQGSLKLYQRVGVMMRTLKISTYLAADLETVKSYLMTPALLNYVVAGLMKFHPIEPNFFPSKWVEGKFSVKMFAFHFLPIGKQIVGMEFPQKSDHWVVRDNGSGSIAKTWDHLIFLESEGGGTRYTDEVSIDAGLFTLPIYIYAFIFYSYRQMRWRKLVNLNFRPLND